MDLMRRIEKNFMKYWSAANLYSEQSRGTNGAESIEVEDGAQGKAQTKASLVCQRSKIKSMGGAIKVTVYVLCVLKRRKRECEANTRLAKGQGGVHELKQEESSPVAESPGGEDSSLNNSESIDLDEDAEMEDKREVKMDSSEQQRSPMEERREEEEEEGEDEDEDEENEVKILGKGEIESKQQSQLGSSLAEKPIKQSQPETADKLGAVAQSQKGSTPAERKEQSRAVHGKRHKELQDKAKMLNSFYPENPMLLNLCRTLFPNNHKSVWRGPYSLFQRQGSSQTTSIQAAIETFMK